MQIENRIRIAAPVGTVLALAEQVEEWPRILPHYRLVRVLALRPEGRIIEMSAYRPGMPRSVRWRTIQRVERPAGRILYRHIGGVSRGMAVEWRLMPTAEGVSATILHDFDPHWPWPGPWIARHVVCDFFVHAIAERTLAGIKAAAEREAAGLVPAGLDAATGGRDR